MVSAFVATFKAMLVAALSLIGIELYTLPKETDRQCREQIQVVCVRDNEKIQDIRYDSLPPFSLDQNVFLSCTLRPATYYSEALPLYIRPDDLNS